MPLGILEQYFGYTSFRGRQLDAIEHTLDGGHSLVIMPTGMGKSLCFQIPALLFARKAEHSLTLVISPLEN